MAAPSITYEDVVRVARTLPRDRVNPREDGVCLYTGHDGSHCIAGEILARLGVAVPGYGNHQSTRPVTELRDRTRFVCDDRTIDLLLRLQQSADRHTHRQYPDPWGRAIDEVLGAE